MKAKVLLIVLLSLISTAIFAAQDNTTADQQWQKTQELNQLAERFKAETGFRGNISYDLNRMCFGYYEGKFAGIQITAEADTASFRAAFEQILDKVLPYTFAKREQLVRSRITNIHGRIKTEYYQQVNGYRVEGIGRLSIVYETGRNAFAIGNGTVQLPEGNVSAIITPEQAEQIALRDMNDENYVKAQVRRTLLSKAGSSVYYLAYFVIVSSNNTSVYEYYDYWIDARTGVVRKKHKTPVYYEAVNVLVKGNCFSPTYDWSNINNNSEPVSIENARVCIADSTKQTGSDGYAILHVEQFLDPKIQLITDKLWVTANPSNDVLETMFGSQEQISPSYYTVSIPDLINGSYHYAPNAFMTAIESFKMFNTLKGGYMIDSLRIDVAHPLSENKAGAYAPSIRTVQLKDARVHSVLRHELGHHFVHCVIDTMMAPADSSLTGIDEALANYLGAAISNDPRVVMVGGSVSLSNTITFDITDATNETQYSNYRCGIPLASAWWALRGNSLFPDGDQGVSGVDTLLVNSLVEVGENIPQNNAYRYKPRYFYNILMRRVDDGSTPYAHNSKQQAIDAAYTSRGFHFTPKVISAGHIEPTVEKNMFRLGDPVYVEITDCPQNTALTVYVVEDQDYTDGMNIGSLNSIICSVSVSDTQIGDDGKWSGFIVNSNSLAVGQYDILVDIGNNGVLHFAYSAANVQDGFDGLHGPGFTVFEDRIDVVVTQRGLFHLDHSNRK